MSRMNRALVIAVVACLVAPGSGLAQITGFDLDVVESPALGGESFGEVGQYEFLRGIVSGEVDPADPRHAHIVNLDNAPRNAAGRVEYRATVEIHRPVDMRRWNRALYHTVSNRGRGGAAEPALLERGFVFVRVGWQGDLTPTESNIVAYLPVASNPDGSPIVGPALEEFIFNDAASVSRGRLTYPAATLEPRGGMLSVRATQDAERTRPDDLQWRYVGDREIEIDRPAGFDGGAIYEFIYEAKDPIVLGIGFAAMRDAISFLRYESADREGNPNPLAAHGLPTSAISLGISQSGRMLRDFLYQGFNEDVAGRIVFDGMHPNIAGSRKTFTNYQFGQPGRWQKQHEDHVYPGDQFPFTYATLTDPLSGRPDGLQERCSTSDTCPKIVHSDGEAELWQARASLVVTDAEGGHIELPDNVRVYLLSGTQHGGGPGVHTRPPSRGMCQNLSNPLALADTRDRPERRAVRVGGEGRGAAGQPVPHGRRRGAGSRERPRISRHPRREVLGLVQSAALGRPPLAAAHVRRRLHGARRAHRRRRQHGGRRAAPQPRGARRDPHGLEPAPRRLRRGGAVRRDGIVHPVRGHRGRPRGDR